MQSHSFLWSSIPLALAWISDAGEKTCWRRPTGATRTVPVARELTSTTPSPAWMMQKHVSFNTLGILRCKLMLSLPPHVVLEPMLLPLCIPRLRCRILMFVVFSLRKVQNQVFAHSKYLEPMYPPVRFSDIPDIFIIQERRFLKRLPPIRRRPEGKIGTVRSVPSIVQEAVCVWPCTVPDFSSLTRGSHWLEVNQLFKCSFHGENF